jgi:hypothetical protein
LLPVSKGAGSFFKYSESSITVAANNQYSEAYKVSDDAIDSLAAFLNSINLKKTFSTGRVKCSLPVLAIKNP